MGTRLVFWLSVFVFALMPFRSALAAPQILAVLASDVGVPFVCRDGQCRADLTTYCLQRQRPAPAYGDVYVPARPESFYLVVTATDGSVRSLPAGDHVSFIETRGFTAVSAHITRPALARLGGEKAVIRIGENASLLPVPVAGDPDPLTDKEIAYATQSLRRHGASVVDHTVEAAAAKLLARFANRLPIYTPFVPGSLETLWQDAIGDELPASAPVRVGIPAAREAIRKCAVTMGVTVYYGVQRCIQFRHDDFIRDINIDYWNSQPNS